MGSGLLTPGHLLILAVVVLLAFGPKRLPELGRSLGRGIREFRSSISGHDDDEEKKPEIESGERPGEPVQGEVVTENRS